MATPAKSPHRQRCQTSNIRISENSDPNILFSSPLRVKPDKSPASKSMAITATATPKKSSPSTLGRILAVVVPAPLPRERKFIIAKKKGMRTFKVGLDFGRHRKEAYDALRASQDEFFRKDNSSGVVVDATAPPAEDPAIERLENKDLTNGKQKEFEKRDIDEAEKDEHHSGVSAVGSKLEHDREKKDETTSNSEIEELGGSSNVRKMRSPMMEVLTGSMTEPGSGRVKHLVMAFENLLTISNENGEKSEERKIEVPNWALVKNCG